MQIKTPITLWSRKNEEGVFEHNHIENGHCDSVRPTPKHENHKKAWAKGEWKAEFAFLQITVPTVIKQ
jgi:hypothetical protein